MKKIATLDIETDPFKNGRIPKPFCCGIKTESEYIDYWGDNCLHGFINYIEELTEPHLIYAHNGGKFDFWFLYYIGLLENPVKIINGRIVSAKIGIHELRDSYAIMPIPLAAYKKDDMDYSKLEKEKREKHKKEILKYLKADCEYLYELVNEFIERFGINLTIGGTAIKKLIEYHPFERTNESHDEKYRPFYYGGRVQFFESGILEGNFKVYDVNSMYPFVMSEKYHPASDEFIFTDDINDLTKKGYLKDYPKHHPFFIEFEGFSDGACPMRYDGKLNFPTMNGQFKITSHELQTGLKHGLIQIDKVLGIWIPQQIMKFNRFVNHYIKEKIDCKQNNDKAGELFAKLMLNSSYGKTGQNPDNFFDYHIRKEGEEIPDLDTWEIYINHPRFEIWRKHSEFKTYYNVAIAASITGAARAVLLDALAQAKRPVYCDTDSIICEELNGQTIDKYQLGAWDCEAEGKILAIAGKKLYALFKNRPIKKDCVKLATKGARLKPHEIVKIAKGERIKWKNDAPNFKLDGQVKFVERYIRKLPL